MDFDEDLYEPVLSKSAVRRANKRKAEDEVNELIREYNASKSQSRQISSSTPETTENCLNETPDNESCLLNDLPTPSNFQSSATTTTTPAEAFSLTFDALLDEDHSNDELDMSVENYDVPKSESSYFPLLCLGFFLRHNLTKSALNDHLKIVSIAADSDSKELRSVHNLLRKYSHLTNGIEKVFVCPNSNCSAELQSDKGFPLEEQHCGHRFIRGVHNLCYVLRLPLHNQVLHFAKRVISAMKNRSQIRENYVADVNSGRRYKELKKNGIIDEKTLTLTLNIDGAVCFKMSKYGFWPFMGIFNEAPYKLRRSTVMLFSIWYGNKKPPVEPFVGHVITKLEELQTTGFEFNGDTYKLRALIVSTDTVARPILRSTTQFNGEYGCDFCLHPGLMVKKGKGNARVYPVHGDIEYTLRTLEQHLRDMKNATPKIPIHGIKAVTPFAKLPNFDFVRAFIPEYMHSCCQGAIKSFIKLWTESKYSKSPWHLKKRKVAILNRRLLNIKPPYEITRAMASLNDISVWKASMYRAFCLYYFPILEDILPKIYFDHFSSFCYGFYVLLQDEASIEDIEKVKLLMKKFVKDAEMLYGTEHISMNFHLLTHLAESVLDWGCLWATSTFIPEWFNGELVKLCNGTQLVADQMAKNYLIKTAAREEATDLINRATLPPKELQLFSDLYHLPLAEDAISSSSKTTLTDEHFIELLGESKYDSLTKEEVVAVEKICNRALYDVNTYARFRTKSTGSVFTSNQYTLSPKRKNFLALLQNGSYIEISKIVEVCEELFSRTVILGKLLGTEEIKIYTPKDIEDINFNPVKGITVRLHGKGENVVAFYAKDILKKCVAASYNDNEASYVLTGIVNSYETD